MKIFGALQTLSKPLSNVLATVPNGCFRKALKVTPGVSRKPQITLVHSQHKVNKRSGLTSTQTAMF